MGSFGYWQVPAADTSIKDIIAGSEATCPDAGQQADSIDAYVNTWNSARKIKCALYLVSDNSLIDETDEKTVTANGMTVVNFVFASPPAITNTDYVITAFAENAGTIDLGCKYTTGTVRNDTDAVYPTFDDPFDDLLGKADHLACIRCNYSVAGAPAGLDVGHLGHELVLAL